MDCKLIASEASLRGNPSIRQFRVWQRAGKIKIQDPRSKIQFGYQFPISRLTSRLSIRSPFSPPGCKSRIFLFTMNRMDGSVQFLLDEVVDKVVEMADFSIEDVSNLRLTSRYCNAAIESGCDSFYKNKPCLFVSFDNECLWAFNPSRNWVRIPRERFSMPEDRPYRFMFPDGQGRSILCYGSHRFHDNLLLSQVDNWVEGSFSWQRIPWPSRPSPFNGMFCVGDAHGETKVLAIRWTDDGSYELLDIFNASRWEWELINHHIRPTPRGKNSWMHGNESLCLVYHHKLYVLRDFNSSEFFCIDMEDKTVEDEFSTVKPQRKIGAERFWLVHGGRHGLLLAGFVGPLQGEEVIQGRDIKKQMSFRVWKLIVEGVPTEGRDVECVEIARMPCKMLKYMTRDKATKLGCVGLKDLIYVYAQYQRRACFVELISKADGGVSSRWRRLPSPSNTREAGFGYKTCGCLNLNSHNIKCMMSCPHPTQV